MWQEGGHGVQHGSPQNIAHHMVYCLAQGTVLIGPSSLCIVKRLVDESIQIKILQCCTDCHELQMDPWCCQFQIMAESKPQALSPEGGSCHEKSSSFNTASDNSQEETVCTIRKREKRGLEEEHCTRREGEQNEQIIKGLKDKSSEDSHSSGDKQRTSSNDNDSGTSLNSCDTAGTDSMNTVNVSKSIEDTSKTKANDSKSSSVNDSKGAKVGSGIGQRLHQGTAASRARQGKKVR